MTDLIDESPAVIEREEHNKDAGAKRVVPRYLNPDTGAWTNFVPPMTPGVEFDYIDIQQTNSTTETYVYKSGGSTGTIVQTIVVVYTDSTKADLDTVTYT